MKVIVTSEQMAAADRYTIEQLGLAGIDLMERAAKACADRLTEHLTAADRVGVICGGGNNGGDGYAIARRLREKGWETVVFHTKARSQLKGDAAANFDRLAQLEIPRVHVEDAKGFAIPADVTWIVDALLGTGLSDAARGAAAQLIDAINQSPAQVLSVDLPSGLSGSQGKLIGPHVRATLTQTFQALKLAHVLTPACSACGQVELHDIGIRFPDGFQPVAYALEADDYAWTRRNPLSHKGSFGTLAVIGGFTGMEGAANLAATAALRFGVGKVRILSDQASNGRFHHDSVMVGALEDADLGAYDACVIGPGLGRGDRARHAIDGLELGSARSVWDADGLTLLGERARNLDHWVMTPHPGEAAAILNTTAGTVQADRLGAIAALRERAPRAWIVLKGYHSLIASPVGTTYVCLPGNAALATAGSGDVLAGMIGALLAMPQCPLEEAVLMATLRHAMTADFWVRNHPDFSMVAEDIIGDLKRIP